MRDVSHSTNKIRTVVVDDEPLARTNLTVLLRCHPEIETVAECGSGLEALSVIRASKPDLVFLDVQMPECDGFDVIERLGSDTPSIIFVTAYDSYALRAFEVGALDYLLKPFDNARFERTLERAKERITLAKNGQPAKWPFVIKTAGQVCFVGASEIDWIEAADYYVSLHVGRKTHLLRRSMAELEQELDENTFCRIHRSAIVKLDKVRRLELNESGEYDVLLTNGTRLRLSRRYRKELQSRLRIPGSSPPT
ncbi:MAG: response regulator transcription factor [Acidobacteria bacterium]|nr:response regulator transcription factor [Acidobacteriota bacterium]